MAGHGSLAFVGSYTADGAFRGRGEGIYRCTVDAATGILTPVGVTAMSNPTYLAVRPGARPVLYAAHHTTVLDGEPGGAVSAWSVGDVGDLHPLGLTRTPAPHATHVSLDREGRAVFAANSFGGAVTILAAGSDGRVEEVLATIRADGDPPVPEGTVPPGGPFDLPGYPGVTVPCLRDISRTTFPHCAVLDPSGRALLVADMDRNCVRVYRYRPDRRDVDLRSVVDFASQPTGPRLLAIHPDGQTIFSIDEYGCTVTAYELDAAEATLAVTGTLALDTAGVTEDLTGSGLVLSPDGRHLYASVRGANVIDHVVVDGGSMRVASVVPCGGDHPRTLAIAPDGRHLYACNTHSDDVAVFRIDPDDGTPELTHVVPGLGSPTCVVFG